jgi:fructose-1,6-bisphosphatase/inositol monophosphatase family enzyme
MIHAAIRSTRHAPPLRSDLIDGAAAVLRYAADRLILPRYRTLIDSEIVEKSPGELVTIADREAETAISIGLAALLPGSRVIGEEACATDSSLIDSAGDGLVWLVDPLDGTANFAAGDPSFAVMAALLREGETIASIILEPLTGRLCAAERGSGAWISGRRLDVSDAMPDAEDMIGVIGRFMPPDVAASVAKRGAVLPPPVPTLKAAGAEYPLIATGARHYALYWRTLAWDHAAGVLLLNEAGGRAARLDGSEWRADRPGDGMLASHNPGIWDEVQRVFRA